MMGMKKYLISIIIIFSIIFIRVFYLWQIKGNYYQELLDKKTNNYIYGSSAPRGRILDRNGKVLVDNIGVNSIYYTKLKGISKKMELEIAGTLANIFSDIKINEESLKDYWLIINNNGEDLIREEEKELYELRKLSSSDIKRLKYERITDELLSELSEEEKVISTIYYLMNKGFSYEKKLIKKGVSDEEFSKIIDSNLPGITTEITWERIYNYEDTLKDIFGSVGSIPVNLKEEYLKLGYSLNDIVGISYLEKEYEEYLKGEKDYYKVNSDNTLSLVKSGKRGSDLVLSIDIDIQMYLESVIESNILKAKNYKNTNYFSESYSIVGNPLTGEILALSGRKLIDEENKIFKNVNTNLINTSYTVGSVVKMATISTGYKYNVIDIGTTFQDSCIKLYQVPIKCSYKSLGRVSDMEAISKSSNYYQFKIALGLTNNEYKYNMKLDVSESDFNKFRGVFSEYGLGVLTGIDLPNESIGIIGSTYSSDLLLNLSIGQYDTYTPIELFQYVNTIGSMGSKKSPSLMKKIINSEKEVILENKYEEVSKVNLESKYLERIKEAMHNATTSGTARNYISKEYIPAGKTGTSETFIDTNNDGIVDTKTTSIAFVGFAPYDNPKYSIVVLAPHIYEDKDYEYSKVYITRYISRDITNFLFEKE